MKDQDNDKTQPGVVLTKGTMVSHYKIVERIGAGGMALGGFLRPSLGLVYSRLGENEEAIQAARRDSARLSLSDDAFLGTDALIDLAVTYARVGEFDNALDLIDTLLSIPSDVTVAKLKPDPNYDPLRDHPRFRVLLEKYEKGHGSWTSIIGTKKRSD